MMLIDFVPYDHYQYQILYLFENQPETRLTIPAAIRVLPILFYSLIYFFLPCTELSNLPSDLSYDYICATSAVSFGNFMLTIFIIIINYSYFKFILKKNLSETLFSVIILYGLLNFADQFAIDKFCIFYIYLILFFQRNNIICGLLILISFLVSEKIFILFGLLFFIKYFFLKKSEIYLKYLTLSIISLFLYFILLKIGKIYFASYDFDINFYQMLKIFYNKTAISNSLIPILLSVFTYLSLIIVKYKSFSTLEVLLPLSMISFGVLGGVENVGRYISYTIPFFLPILTNYLYYKLKIK